MNIRETAFYIIVIALSIYAWKDWFISLCGLIILAALVGHPTFPKSVFSIQGLNLWNVLFANVMLAWIFNRAGQGLLRNMSTIFKLFFILWLCVIIVGWIRMIADRDQLRGFTFLGLISEQLINTIKWPLISLPLFDGCHTRKRVKMVIACIVVFFALFTVQIVRAVPQKAVRRSARVDLREEVRSVSLSPNGAGKVMSGAPWAFLAVMPLLKKWKYRFLILGLSGLSIYAIALTGSRSAYVASAATIVLLCFLRWRRAFLLLPIMLFILPIVFPASTKRMWSGFDSTSVSGEERMDENIVTSGRNMIWPIVIDKISESPVIGFGREATQRTGLTNKLAATYGESEGVAVTHPHQAYLQMLLDNGLVGLMIIVGLHLVLLFYSIRLFIERTDPLFSVVGGLTLALLTSHLVDYMGGQTFYAQAMDVGLWSSVGLTLRLYSEIKYHAFEPYALWTSGLPVQSHSQGYYSLMRQYGGIDS